MIYFILIISTGFMLVNGCKKLESPPEPASPGAVIKDIDSNVYHAVTIGTQTWLVENLKVTHFNNGDPIPNIEDFTTWQQQDAPAYCWYNNNNSNMNPYGALYNWFTVGDSRKVAPPGWHVPTDAEWATLIKFLGGEGVAGGPLKEAGTTHWTQPNTGATNSSGFTAAPGGYRSISDFADFMIGADIWSSTQSSDFYAWDRYLFYNKTQVDRGFNGSGVAKTDGKSIRCIKD